MGRVVALTGISGVGKSTLLATLSTRVQFLSLQASALIRRAREKTPEHPVAHDRLRYADLDENQRLLIQGFESSTTEATSLVILDGHTVVERDEDYVCIDPAVFGAIGISAMIFLKDDPTAIFDRRAHDIKRLRPKKDPDALAYIQMIAHAHARDICRTLHVPLYLAAPQDVDQVTNIFCRMCDIEPE